MGADGLGRAERRGIGLSGYSAQRAPVPATVRRSLGGSKLRACYRLLRKGLDTGVKAIRGYEEGRWHLSISHPSRLLSATRALLACPAFLVGLYATGERGSAWYGFWGVMVAIWLLWRSDALGRWMP